MKVFDLRCGAQHVFEGWFGSEDDFVAQAAKAMVGCPLCGDTDVRRLPSAPRLNLSAAAGRAETAEPVPATPLAAPFAGQRSEQARWMRAMREVVERTEDVGERFPEEARRIHYGEVEARGIRGRASREQAEALADEGIEVMALPLPAALKGPVQ